MLQEMDIKRLTGWFEKDHRVMPWRTEVTPYRVWISEIMLQQTQVAAVIPYFEQFMKEFPDVASLASASLDEVLKLWAGLGYYSRARNIKRAAELIHSSGTFPSTVPDLLALPGIGPYTAGAIASIVYGIPAPIVDGNVIRVFARQMAQTQISSSREEVWNWAREQVLEAKKMGISPRIYNQSVMELGATLCTPKSPDCGHCPVSKSCKGSSTPGLYPKPVSKRWIEVEEDRLLIRVGPKILLTQARVGEWRAGLWDLPTREQVEEPGVLIAKVKLIVTRHKILRKIYSSNPPSDLKERLRGSEPELQLFDENLLPAHGTGLKKSLQAVRTTDLRVGQKAKAGTDVHV